MLIHRIKEHLVFSFLGLMIAAFAALGVVKQFFTETAPWIADAVGGLGFALLAALALTAAAYWGFQYVRYRAATKKLMWRYIIDVQEEQVGKPGRGPGQSDAVKRGEQSATTEWGDKMYREVLHLPPEDEYR